ncbi:prepilin-type N-terminal cleavage/methylation domain-containing protein [Candidatus Saccharibacteria bacterium TM7i]|nr:prepilin-type N-terminal cleavage/methylation domain-containing protein [Candidatus Saccharibacteria bacterium TM7i]
MMRNNSTHPGFTAIELLITLFIAAMALATGYQLYIAIITESGNTRMEAEVGSMAYSRVRSYTTSAVAPCTPATLFYQPSINLGNGIGDGMITVTRDCPNMSLPNLNRITASIRYGSPQKTVTHATYVSPEGL